MHESWTPEDLSYDILSQTSFFFFFFLVISLSCLHDLCFHLPWIPTLLVPLLQFQTAFHKNSIFFFLLKVNIFFMFLDNFDVLIWKIILKNKTLFWCIFEQKELWKATATTLKHPLRLRPVNLLIKCMLYASLLQVWCL